MPHLCNFAISGTDSKFTIKKFNGVETLSSAYRFELEVSTTKPIDNPESLLWQSCEFSMFETRERMIAGMVTLISVTKKINTEYFYNITIRPTFWGLSEEVNCEVFLEMSVTDIISQVLSKPRAGLQIPFEIKVSEEYQPREFVAQHNQSSFDFLGCLMEQYGLYYYFEYDQDSCSEKLIITDNQMVHQKLSAASYRYYPSTGLESTEKANLIDEFAVQHKAQPKSILLKNYNYQKPDVDVEGISSVDDKGVGQQYYYGEQFCARKEGNQLAKLKSEQIKAEANLCHGQANDPQMAPGWTFGLTDHFQQDSNQDYLLVEVRHRGCAGSSDNDLSYENEFECLSTKLQYRSQEKTPKAKIYGVIDGRIDASGDDEIDEHGRYKVLFNFDLSNPNGGKASHWVRKMTHYSDAQGGMHFPLRKGTEVKLAFEHGDPSRPVIVGAVSNPNSPSVVNEFNSNDHVIQTPSGSHISMSDGASNSTILISSDDQTSFIKITK